MQQSGPTDMQAAKARRAAERLEARLPRPMRRFVHWIRQPSSRWLRIPAGILLIVGGFLGFLPILGFWMIPLGLLLLAEDVPPFQRLARWMIVTGEVWWRRWKRRNGDGSPRKNGRCGAALRSR